jgi:hypothetical protein
MHVRVDLLRLGISPAMVDLDGVDHIPKIFSKHCSSVLTTRVKIAADSIFRVYETISLEGHIRTVIACRGALAY